jgi:hypothetical protein
MHIIHQPRLGHPGGAFSFKEFPQKYTKKSKYQFHLLTARPDLAGLFAFNFQEDKMIDCDKFMARFASIEARVKADARFFAFVEPRVTEDDLLQQSLLKLLEQCNVKPEFLEQNDSYLRCFCSWAMKNFLTRETNLYHRRISDQNGEECEFQFSGHIPRAESELVRSEIRDLVNEMPIEYRTIYTAIAQGYEPEEIADMLGIGIYTIARRKSHLIRMARWAYEVPKNKREHIIREMYR